MELTLLEKDEEDDYLDDLPGYSDRGRLIVKVIWGGERVIDDWYGPWDYEVLDYDPDSCIMWINEGIGLDFFLRDVDFPDEGTYLITNIHGQYFRGEWGYTDDDEEWYWDDPVKTNRDTLLDDILEWENLIRQNNPIMAPPNNNPACGHLAWLVWMNNKPSGE